MKELSIEEKAKSYDELLDKAKQIYNKENDVLIKHIIEGLFPELKESEDERIRKGIISGMKALQEKGKYTCFANIPMDNIFAWLEKQGNKVIDFPQNHKDMNNPNGCIVLEDFNGGEGFYKLHLDYLNKKQVEEIEKIIRTWNKKSILNYGRP